MLAMKSSLSNIGIIWSILSFSSSVLMSAGFYFPYWIRGTIPHSTLDSSFGIFRVCTYLIRLKDGSSRWMNECGRFTDFWDIPSVWWQAASVVMGVGCVLSLLISCAALICCCTPDSTTKSLAILAGGLQAVVVVFVACGCVIYPLGWDNAQVFRVCGRHSGKYSLGQCTMAWAFYATVTGALGTLICSLIACYSPKYKGGYKGIPPAII